MADEWVKEFPGGITVCDTQGIILEMNAQAIHNNRESGGADLIGKNMLDCHPESMRAEVKDLLASPQSSIYAKEQDGVHKLVYQVPWYKNGEYRGFVALNLEIPAGLFTTK